MNKKPYFIDPIYRTLIVDAVLPATLADLLAVARTIFEAPTPSIWLNSPTPKAVVFKSSKSEACLVFVEHYRRGTLFTADAIQVGASVRLAPNSLLLTESRLWDTVAAISAESIAGPTFESKLRSVTTCVTRDLISKAVTIDFYSLNYMACEHSLEEIVNRSVFGNNERLAASYGWTKIVGVSPVFAGGWTPGQKTEGNPIMLRIFGYTAKLRDSTRVMGDSASLCGWVPRGMDVASYAVVAGNVPDANTAKRYCKDLGLINKLRAPITCINVEASLLTLDAASQNHRHERA